MQGDDSSDVSFNDAFNRDVQASEVDGINICTHCLQSGESTADTNAKKPNICVHTMQHQRQLMISSGRERIKTRS